jgi:cyclase
VVDSHGTPRAAQMLIRRLRELSPKPVKYLVNTHFHFDHVQGNQAYLAAWPAGIEIISSEATRERLERVGVTRLGQEINDLREQVARLRREADTITSPTQRREAAAQLRETVTQLHDVEAVRLVLPTLTFDHSLILRQGARTVQFLYLGRGHTEGDVVVFLPRERVVATGDLLTGWAPYAGDAYPADWAVTLKALHGLDYDYVIGGHGELMHGKAQCELWIEYLRDLQASTERAAASGATLEQTQAQVVPILKARFADRFSPKFLDRVSGNVARVYELAHSAAGASEHR